ncbi:hypothetical protein AYX14_01558 [Cryptococcus neoformans]|nr:hypothetical protein AYX14_01558 [Cryptococcus neoformans var. grubii]
MMSNGDYMANSGNNPTGPPIEITDNQMWAPAPGSGSYSPAPASTLYTGGGYNGADPTNTVVPPWGSGGSHAPPPCVAESSAQLVTSAPAVALTVGTTSKTAQQATPASATSIDGTACTKSDQKSYTASFYAGSIERRKEMTRKKLGKKNKEKMRPLDAGGFSYFEGV